MFVDVFTSFSAVARINIIKYWENHFGFKIKLKEKKTMINLHIIYFFPSVMMKKITSNLIHPSNYSRNL